MVQTFNWKLTCFDCDNGEYYLCMENASIWEVRKEIARTIRSLRAGYRHLLGTEYPKDVIVKEDGSIYGWCMAPLGLGKYECTATVATLDEIADYRDSRDLDKESRLYPYGEASTNRYKPDYDCTYTGSVGGGITIRKVS
jgi:hypothetical protein